MEAALCELQQKNNIFLNQTEVEVQDKMNDLQDLKGPAAIGATETKQDYDDLEAWITKLDTTDVVSGKDLALFPELEEPTDVSELSQCYMEEFIDVDSMSKITPVETNEMSLSTSSTMAENFDLSAFLQLDNRDIDDEVATASKLLTTEELQLADTLISYVEGDSNVSSPEMSHQSVDALLDELLGNPIEKFDTSAGSPNACADTATIATTAPSKTVPEFQPCVENITVDCELDLLSDAHLDEKVVEEFANLLNSLDDSFNKAQPVQTLSSDNSWNFVDINNADTFTTIEHLDVQCIKTDAMKSDTSVKSPAHNTCGATSVRKQKRKHSDTISEEEQSEKKISRRMKNNEASKVTRAKRRSRHQELFDKERKLTENNAELRIKLEVMQREADILRQLLVVALNNSSKN